LDGGNRKLSAREIETMTKDVERGAWGGRCGRMSPIYRETFGRTFRRGQETRAELTVPRPTPHYH